MPEANTMEPLKTELVESFIKYITGVYLLQQEFIDDMQGGLQSVLEKYNVSSVNEQLDNVQETVVAVAPKKTRKKSTKKEVVEEQAVEEEQEQEQVVEPVKPVKPVKTSEEQQEDLQDLQDLQAAEPSVMEEELNIPSHVSSVLNTQEKKTRKPRAKKGEAVEEPKKKRPITAYRAFIVEYSKNPELKGLKVSERTQLASPIWEKIKEDPERLKEYEEKADAINKENGL